MRITSDEEIAVLYALFCCGGETTKATAIDLILRNRLLRTRVGDDDQVATGESRIANRLAWTRENLKRKGQVVMPHRGIWRITASGQQRLMAFAAELQHGARQRMLLEDAPSLLAPNFVARLKALRGGDVYSRCRRGSALPRKKCYNSGARLAAGRESDCNGDGDQRAFRRQDAFGSLGLDDLLRHNA